LDLVVVLVQTEVIHFLIEQQVLQTLVLILFLSVQRGG
jgi:hypothetical protein